MQKATRQGVNTALPKIADLARKLIDAGEVPGLAIGIVFEDEVVYLDGFGVREAGKSEKINADTVFQLASVSKSIGSAVVAAIVGGETVSWDTRIADIDPLPHLKDRYAATQVTLRDLFAHRSGLPGDAGNDLEDLGFERDEILRRLRYVEPESSFRSAYSYSNFGLTLAAVSAARTIGISWEDAAESKLYKPLGMTQTSSRHADFVKRTNRSALHIRVAGTWTAKLTRNADAQSPAGGVSSNARDLVQWVRLELGLGKLGNEQLIPVKAIEETHVPVIMRGNSEITGPAFYALGWNVDYGPRGVTWNHAGAFSVGARTQISMLPKERLGIVVLSNAFPTGVPEAITDSFYDFVFDDALSRDWVKPWNDMYESSYGPAALTKKAGLLAQTPASPVPALALAAYVGTYANDYVGQAQVLERDNALLLKLGPKGAAQFPLKRFNRDLFTYTSSPEQPELPSAALFEIGADGKARALRLDDLRYTGHAALPRVGG